MTSHGDYIPKGFSPLADFSENLLNKSSASQSRLGILAAALAALQVAVNTYLAAHEIAKNPAATDLDRENRRDAAKEVTAVIRDFVNTSLRYNHAVTNADRVDMGLTIPDHNPTPVPAPATYPEFSIDSSVIRQLSVRFHDQGSTSKAKPHGVHGAEIRWGILDEVPTDVDDLRTSSFATRSPLTLSFHEYERGKSVYFCLRWENTHSQKGPWSEIVRAIIP